MNKYNFVIQMEFLSYIQHNIYCGYQLWMFQFFYHLHESMMGNITYYRQEIKGIPIAF